METNPYWQLREELIHSLETKRLDIPVFELAPIMPRGDSLDIFEEGALFGSATEGEYATACITSVASAHVMPTIPTSLYISAAEQTFESTASLPPAGKDVTHMPPQAIVWWALKSDGAITRNSDFATLANAELAVSSEALELVAEQTEKAVRFVNLLKGTSIIWGSWGNGDVDERKATGMTRGVPTNKIGHSHIVHIDESLTDLTASQARPTVSEQANFADLWTHVVLKNFGEDLACTLTQSLTLDASLPPHTIRLQTPNELCDTTRIGAYYGFDVQFEDNRPYTDILQTLVRVAGFFDTLYRTFSEYHQAYYLQTTTVDKEAVNGQLRASLVRFGFDPHSAHQLAAFTARIKPTRTQLEKWREQNDPAILPLFERYRRVSARISRLAASQTLLPHLVADTYQEDSLAAQRTLPVHSSAWYIIQHPEINESGLTAQNIQIFPTLSSSMGAPERILGGVQRRQLAS